MTRDEELATLIAEQKRDDTKWQSPEPGVVSYDRWIPGDPTVEGFVAWFNETSKRKAVKTGKKQKTVEPTDTQRELMALTLIRQKAKEEGWKL